MKRNCRHVALLVGTLVTAVAACGGGGSNAATPTTSRARRDATVTTRPSTSSPSDGSALGAGGVDLATTPPLGAIGYRTGSAAGEGVLSLRNAAAIPKVVELGLSPQERSTTRYTVSPSGRYVAVARDGDALDTSVLAVVDVATGRTVDTAELDAQTLTSPIWSPDDQAIVVRGDAAAGPYSGFLHKLHGGSAAGRVVGSAYAFETRGDQVIYAVQGGDRLTADDTAGSTEVLDPTVRVFQGATRDEAPLIVLSQRSGVAIGDTTAPQVLAAPGVTADWPSVQIAQSCGRIALGSNPATGEVYFVDTATAALYPAPRGTPCPLPSPDGSKIAYATDAGGTDEGVAVLALDDQNRAVAPVKVGRQGEPIAWSADSRHLIVQGNGTFLVASDGSGGTRTSLQLSGGAASFCPTPDHRSLIVFQQSEVFRVDLRNGRSSDLGGGTPGEVCTVATDGRWVASGTTLIDLARGRAGDVRNATARYGSYRRLWFVQRSIDVPVRRVGVR